MARYTFSKLIPGGNPTILLHEPDLTAGALADVSAHLMEDLHLGAEQVGALYVPGGATGAKEAFERPPGAPGGLPVLRMMGGEFCVNAARCAALALARRGCLHAVAALPDARLWTGELAVSGADRPVTVLASESEQALAEALALGHPVAANGHAPPPASERLHCAARVDLTGSRAGMAQRGVCLVSLPGMDHLLVDTARHALPDMEGASWRSESAALRLLCGLTKAPASGVVWYEAEGGNVFRIWPAVEVKATESEHLESACGSASLALALALSRGLLGAAPGAGSGGEAPAAPAAGQGGTPEGAADASASAAVPGGLSVEVIQPSGRALQVYMEPSGAAAWVAGPVLLAAEGTAYL